MSIERNVILPGSVIGMVGGGQLGRMFAIAAAAMGYRVGVFCGSSDEPASQVADFTVCGPLSDSSAIELFAARCDVITFEFENIPAATIAACAKHAPTHPDSSVLECAQDRWLEKTRLSSFGLPVTPFAPVQGVDSVAEASAKIGWPMIVKTCRSGYDGKGQYRLSQLDDARSVDWSSGGDWIAESVVPFDLEVSVIVARNVLGEVRSFPVFENHHERHILDTTTIPARISEPIAAEARRIAVTAAEQLNVVGLLCVEMFVVGQNVLINEIAPRPHNSGHLTIEGCSTSQFQQHVRAICGLPLGRTEPLCQAAGMVNLLGDLWPGESSGVSQPQWSEALAVPGVNLHLYGKHAARPGRKMGHLTTTGISHDDVLGRLDRARRSLSKAPTLDP